MNICAIIPSYNPDEKLSLVVRKLIETDFKHIIVVDDGSKDKKYFEELPECCDVLHHYKNLGKGRALKTAFNYYLNNYRDECDGIVTLDGDNQHHIADVKKCIKALEKKPNHLILGCRNFYAEGVPQRSKFGNQVTSFFFKAFCGLTISDTQTGLRAMSNNLVEEFMDVAGERFEFETNMLLETKIHGINISEVDIRTIYINENRGSHFNPLKDSWAIYKVLFSFIWASIASTLIDLGIFHFLLSLIFTGTSSSICILLSTVIARILSSLFNFFVNKTFVFQNKHNFRSTMAKYYFLCALQMMTSFIGVWGLTLLLPSVTPIWLKIIVDFTLFLVSFQIQREWVFKNEENA